MAKKHNRAPGEGTIYQNANKTFTAQIRTPEGRPSFTHASIRKVRAWLTQQQRELDTGDYIAPSDLTLTVWWDTWVKTYKAKSVSPATLATYKYSKARLPETLLKQKMADIKPADVQAALNAINGQRRTVEITRTALKMCLNQAVKDGLLRKSPADNSTLPLSTAPGKAKALTPEDDAELLKRLTGPGRITASGQLDLHDQRTQTIRDALYFVRMTGVRREEAVSLEWAGVGDQLHITGTKNKYSDRFIPLLPEVKAMLDRRRFRKNSDFVFATSTGAKLHGTALKRWMEKNSNYTVHDLRHTYITRAAQAGINPKVLASLTGHAKVETLLNIYTHVTDTDKYEAAAKIAASSK